MYISLILRTLKKHSSLLCERFVQITAVLSRERCDVSWFQFQNWKLRVITFCKQKETLKFLLNSYPAAENALRDGIYKFAKLNSRLATIVKSMKMIVIGNHYLQHLRIMLTTLND